MQEEGISFLSFAFPDPHNHLKIDNWQLEENLHTQKALRDHYTGHECHLKHKE